MFSALIYTLILALPVAFLFHRYFWPATIATATNTNDSAPAHVDPKPVKNIMQPPRQDLQPPKDDPFTLEQLKEYDGSDPEKPVYVSIKGASKS
jgi:membrane-associated progesterone receptor component